MALVKNWQFFHILRNIGKIAQQSVFESILERKKQVKQQDEKLKK